MATRYSAAMRLRQTLPKLWLLTDLRTDARLDRAIAGLPRGSAVVFRHYHLPLPERKARFRGLARVARKRGLWLVWSGPAREAVGLRADACYGPARSLTQGPQIMRLVTVHSLAEIGRARRASAVVLSPVYPTRSHPGGKTLGPVRYRLIESRSRVPVIALGGMNARSSRRLGTARWAAIDGLAASTQRKINPRIPRDS